MKKHYHRDIPLSKNNHLYFIDKSFVNFAKKYMESVPSYEDIDVEINSKSEKGKLLKKILQ